MRLKLVIICCGAWLSACAGGEIAPLPSPGDSTGDDGMPFAANQNNDEEFIPGDGDDGGSGTTGGTTDSVGEPAEPGPEPRPDPPTRYPAGQIHSPINSYVSANIKAIAGINANYDEAVFMKVGASSTVSSLNLNCFAGSHVDLEQDSDLLTASLNHFLSGNANGVTPFERKTIAAKVGMSVGWAISGDPSPVEAEIDAISPKYAIMHYGTNDMGMGSTYLSAVWKFGERMLNLMDSLIDQGIVPIVMGITPRGDSQMADRWVSTYNAVIRGLAQARQVPHIDLGLAVQPLKGFGLAGDGIHLNTYKENGAYRACIMTDAGLQFGFNVRNLVSLQALDAAHKCASDLWDAPDDTLALLGQGSIDAPFEIDALPFSDLRDTHQSQQSALNFYEGCSAIQDESGPEFIYRLTLEVETRIRALVFDRDSVDIDLHLLGESANENSCLERDHQVIQATLAPGTYHFSLDTFVSVDGKENAGEYLFVILECHPDDSSCD
jgi:hypothetical protein